MMFSDYYKERLHTAKNCFLRINELTVIDRSSAEAYKNRMDHELVDGFITRILSNGEESNLLNVHWRDCNKNPMEYTGKYKHCLYLFEKFGGNLKYNIKEPRNSPAIWEGKPDCGDKKKIIGYLEENASGLDIDISCLDN